MKDCIIPATSRPIKHNINVSDTMIAAVYTFCCSRPLEGAPHEAHATPRLPPRPNSTDPTLAVSSFRPTLGREATALSKVSFVPQPDAPAISNTHERKWRASEPSGAVPYLLPVDTRLEGSQKKRTTARDGWLHCKFLQNNARRAAIWVCCIAKFIKASPIRDRLLTSFPCCSGEAASRQGAAASG